MPDEADMDRQGESKPHGIIASRKRKRESTWPGAVSAHDAN